jgi:hypothetical protein
MPRTGPQSAVLMNFGPYRSGVGVGNSDGDGCGRVGGGGGGVPAVKAMLAVEVIPRQRGRKYRTKARERGGQNGTKVLDVFPPD